LFPPPCYHFLMQKILILVNLVVVLLGAGLVYYSHFMIKPEPTNQAAETEKLKTEASEKAKIEPVPIKKFVVNLYSGPSRLRYLDVEMNVLTFHADQKEIVKNNEHIFKDVVIAVAAQMQPSDLDSMTGKITFESRVKKGVNERLGTPVVKQIYFSTFVVQ
ncbi:MAG: flagellar basal body-associated protein FliL, partial [Bacteriovoracaceae bacterium]